MITLKNLSSSPYLHSTSTWKAAKILHIILKLIRGKHFLLNRLSNHKLRSVFHSSPVPYWTPVGRGESSKWRTTVQRNQRYWGKCLWMGWALKLHRRAQENILRNGAHSQILERRLLQMKHARSFGFVIYSCIDGGGCSNSCPNTRLVVGAGWNHRELFPERICQVLCVM